MCQPVISADVTFYKILDRGTIWQTKRVSYNKKIIIIKSHG